MQRFSFDGGIDHALPGIGDRVERVRAGVTQRGSVHYADQIQFLVKWDDGSSSSLRAGRDRVRILAAEPGTAQATAAA